jgi:hypothetical protein
MQQKRKVGRPAGKQNIDKNAILKIALEAFAEFGFEGVSVNKIAKRAGVHDSLLHYHFGSKKDIWKKSITQVAIKYDEESTKMIRLFKGEDIKLLGKALIRHFIYFMSENIEMHKVVIHELTQKTERTDWIMKAALIPFSDKVDTFYKNYMTSDPVYKMPPANHFAIVYGMATNFFTIQHLIDKKYSVDVFAEAEIEQHVELVTEILFATLFKKK